MGSNFKEIYQKSISKPEEFWNEISNDIFWFQKPTKILNKSNDDRSDYITNPNQPSQPMSQGEIPLNISNSFNNTRVYEN